MGFPVRVILLSSICPLLSFSALFFCGFISLGLYLFFFFFSTVSICCCLLAFSLTVKQRPAALPIHTSSSDVTNTDINLSSSSSSSSPPSGNFKYDVFLSFRGEDTRRNFTDHLYSALKQKGIYTFRDDEELNRGEMIGPNLLKAIEDSRYVIVVFSPNYADSAWCLDELAKVAECKKEMGQKVLPVFYHVDPSEVRRQTGDHFGKAFEKHQKRFKGDPEKIKRWKEALFQVGNLSGWHLQDGYESEVIQDIVGMVFTQLNKIIFTSEGLVGMDAPLNELFSYLDIGRLDDVRIIGICGMGGIGKTTIAQVVFKRLRAQFVEGDSFLANVKHETEKQGSTIHLQEKLLLNLLNSNVNVQNTEMGKDIMKHRLSTKRVLVVLDDVDQDMQLETLCDRTWFGPGSRIIITSRDEHLITAFGADKVYKVNALTDPEDFHLFRLKAFNEDEIGEDFLKLSYEFLKYANGLPLAIKVLGSSVRGRNEKLWSSALKRLGKNPPKGIIDVLKVSFDGLEETEKKTFLDIACFFKGENKDRVIRILSGCDNDGVEMDVQVLIDRSLVTLFGTKLWMHDLIQEMGREVVIEECREEPGRRSRLWQPKEIIRVLGQNKATNAVQSIYLPITAGDDVLHSIDNAFSTMDRLRLLKIWDLKCSGNIRYLSNDLQYLEWHECPLDSFPSDFQPENLVEVHMHFSRIKQLWRGQKGWSMLRHLDLSGSPSLISTPDFTGTPSLEELMLEGCTSLILVHPSLGFLKKLRKLDLQFCQSIESLPPFTTLESLQELRLSNCLELKNFPEIKGNMESLLELDLDCTSIDELPPSIERLTGLTMLDLTDCKNLLHLPNTVGCLTSLKCLYLQGCSKLDTIPENLNGMKCLEKLFIGETCIRELSYLAGMKSLQYLSCRGCKCLVSESCKSLSLLSSLVDLDLSYCNLMDGAFLNDFSSLISLRGLDLSGNCFVRLPESISQLPKLETLVLSNCWKLRLLPKKLPSSLQNVYAEDTALMDYPNQIKILESSESGVTIVNSLNSSSVDEIPQSSMTCHHKGGGMEGESFALRVGCHHKGGKHLDHSLLRSLTYQKHEMSFCSNFRRIAASDEIPDRFITKSTKNPISISIPHYYTGEKQIDHSPLPSLTYKKHEMSFCSNFSRIAASDEIPDWFITKSTRNPISISIPHSLVDDNKWKGFAACAIFAVKGHTSLSLIDPDPDFCNYSYQIKLETDVMRLKQLKVLGSGGFASSSHLRVVFNIPRLQFQRRGLNQSTVVRATFETTNPSMVVQKCGLRLVYEQDAGWYIGLDSVDVPICLNEVEDAASVRQSCWLTQSLEWERIPPLREESTLMLRKNLESVLPRFLEAVNGCVRFNFNLTGSPGWFQQRTQWHEWMAPGYQMPRFAMLSLELPQNVHKSKKWMGFAIYASLVEEVGQTMKHEEYEVSVILKLGDNFQFFPAPKHCKHLSEEYHRLLVIYIPRAEIPEELFTRTLATGTNWVGIRITGSPHVRLERIGFRIVYQEDCQGFADTIINCMHREDTLKFYDKLLVEKWIAELRLPGAHLESRTERRKQFGLQLQKYRNWEWSDPHSVCCQFKRCEISKLKWFMPFINQGSCAEIQLPPNLFDNDNWLGFAVCFQLSHDQYPITLGSTAPVNGESIIRRTFHLDSDVAWQGLYDFGMDLSLKIPEPSVDNMTWFDYIPRTKCLSKMWRQCKLARITIWSSSPCLAVDNCALRLLFKEDVKHLVETLILAETLSFCSTITKKEAKICKQVFLNGE